MMLRPAVSQILKNNESYYSLVIAVAKRAREITSDAFDNKLVLDEKPVKTAVDELFRYRLCDSGLSCSGRSVESHVYSHIKISLSNFICTAIRRGKRYLQIKAPCISVNVKHLADKVKSFTQL